ncbi:hypothetical protein [Thalassospira sp. HJ]|uniref:hypothetical protein n=1 Tax=Thalassospira sp. HJ TaxID=1616823 RepID=UPI000696FF46|nr:hypothetical protein [Thalassospira sp. HJ]
MAENSYLHGQWEQGDWAQIVKNMADVFVIVSICENICCGFAGLRGSSVPVILGSRFIAVQRLPAPCEHEGN